MSLPFSSDDENRAEVRRRSLSRRKKALALMASGHQPYARLGANIEDEANAEEQMAQRDAQRQFDEALRSQGADRERSQDAAAAARHAELLAFQRDKEANDVARSNAQLGLQRQSLAQQAAEAKAMQAYREAQLALAGRKLAPRGAPGTAPQAFVGDEPIPHSDIDPKSPVFQKKAVMDSSAAIARLNRAWKLLQKSPDAYGGANQALGAVGAAAGAVPVLGHALGPLTQSGTQRLMTSKERDVRNEVDALVDEAIKVISGGQVTQYEELRKTYLPKAYDNKALAEDKIYGMLLRSIGTYKSYGGPDDLSLPQRGGPSAVDSIVKKYLGGQPPAGPSFLKAH